MGISKKWPKGMVTMLATTLLWCLTMVHCKHFIIETEDQHGVAGGDYEAGADYYDYGGGKSWEGTSKKQWDKDWTTKKQWDKDWTTKKQWDTTRKRSTWKTTWTPKPKPCQWNNWQHWSYISATCGKQTRTRNRFCACPDGSWGKRRCSGSSSMKQDVNQGVCPTLDPYTPAPYLEGKRRK